jgi:thiol-disulfide isomerase/thioredoxin
MVQSILLSALVSVVLVMEADQPNPLPRNPPPSAPKPLAAKPNEGNGGIAKSDGGSVKPANATTVDNAPLSIGDPAPKLDIDKFVKGQAVSHFDKGKTYVVEFWATWCAPCRELIPHLTKLQAENSQATFIGVSIDEEADKVKPFVDEMGDKMNYRVAIDAREGNNGRMAKSWIDASARGGVIPVAFVVNGDGRIAWIGHPADLEAPLVDILGGKWDLAAEAAEYKKAMAEARMIAKLKDDLGVLLKKKDYAGAIKLLDVASKKIELPEEPMLVEIALLAGPENEPARAYPIAEKLFAKSLKAEDGGTLMMLANGLADPRGFLPGDSSGSHMPTKLSDPKLAALAVRAAEKGEELTHTGNALDDAETMVIVAKTYRAAGRNDKAAEKLDEAAGIVSQSIDEGTKLLGNIRDMKSSLEGAAKPPAGASKKPAGGGA